MTENKNEEDMKQCEMSKSEKLSILLVHGFWGNGSNWNQIILLLLAAGHNVIAVQNPLTSLEDDVEAVKRAMDRAGGPILLAGHSWAGSVNTKAGTDERVKGLVYVAALGPDTGESAETLGAKFDPTPLFNHTEKVDGYIWLKRDGLPYFAGDLSEDQQNLIYATQSPPNAILLETKLEGTPAWKSKPSWYVVAKEDRAINPDQQRFMAKRMGATTVEVSSSHVPMMSQPQAVFDLIQKAAIACHR